MRRDGSLWQIGRELPALSGALPGAGKPDWQQADPAFIERALDRSQRREGGGWCVVMASAELGEAPTKVRMVGVDWVVWRAGEQVRVAPNACPHMGAELHCGRVRDRKLVCPWHGLALGQRHGDWQTVQAVDDGVLIWARVLTNETPTDAPMRVARPEVALSGVVQMEARCEPQDVIANRLDPWHGAHYHPHSFAKLEMLEVDEDRLVLRVAYRVAGPFCVEVDASFHSPMRRSIVMTILDGDGAGSVVETHATPIDRGRTNVIEATLATSDRPGFRVARRFHRLIRPFIERRAERLWVEDVAYAERRYTLRTG